MAAVRATPWSPAKTTTRTRSNGRGGQVPWTAHSHSERSSRRPSAPVGLVSRACRSAAAPRASESGSVMRAVERVEVEGHRHHPWAPAGHSGTTRPATTSADLVALGGDPRVERAEQVAVEPAGRMLGHDAAADLVAHEHHPRARRADGVDEPVDVALDRGQRLGVRRRARARCPTRRAASSRPASHSARQSTSTGSPGPAASRTLGDVERLDASSSRRVDVAGAAATRAAHSASPSRSPPVAT